METYLELKARQSKEFNEFQGIFFAFSNSQFAEGMQKVGLEPTDTKAIFSIGAGGYIRKDVADKFHELMTRQETERKEQRKDAKRLYESLVYELNNHEFCITHDPKDALNALGLDINEVDKDILKKAMREANQ